jgi:quinoprotein glucose dehydrogenase
MPTFDGARLSEALMWGMTPLDQLLCRIKFRRARYDGMFTPPGVRPTVNYPGYDGGMNWGGVAVDPDKRLMVVDWARMAYYTRLIPRAEANAMGIRRSSTGLAQENSFQMAAQEGTPFAVRYSFFLTALGVPCLQPPFAKIAVVDLDTRRVRWTRTLGTSADLGPLGLSSYLRLPMGAPPAGGPIITRSGVIFIGAALERRIRAFDVRDGRKLWEMATPEAVTATPISYTGPRTGRQFVAAVEGGRVGVMGVKGEYLIAYSLR